LMASGMSMGGAPMEAFGGAGRTLGAAGRAAGAGAGTSNNAGAAATASGGVFAGTGNKLGGATTAAGRGHTLGGDKVFTTWMSPAEAAVAAADARRRAQQLRLRGDHCCRPCTIDISDSEKEEDADDAAGDDNQQPLVAKGSNAAAKPAAASSNKNNDRKKQRTDSDTENRKPAAKPNQSSNVVVCIDLTSDGEEEPDTKPPAVTAKWSCRQCTFRNRPMALACEMCAAERNRHVRADDFWNSDLSVPAKDSWNPEQAVRYTMKK